MISVPADFSDWLSPILVKELRQGMRKKVFVISFILLQVAMVFLAISSVAAASVASDTEAFTAFFWIIISLPLMVTMPASGLSAIGAEKRAGTLELMFLTRLSARRIFLGKWFAIVAQTTLLVTTVLPYVVLRYFIGGVNLGQELLVLVAMLLGSAMLSAVAVGFSPLPAILVRLLSSLAALGLFFGSIGVTAAMEMSGQFGGMPLRYNPFAPWLLFLGTGSIIFWLMIEFGASCISPPSENHSSPVRLIGFVAVLGTGAFALLDIRMATTAMVILKLLLALICACVLNEQICQIPSLYRPFVRRGWVGRLAGRFLYPGWATGVFYTIAVQAAYSAVSFFQFKAMMVAGMGTGRGVTSPAIMAVGPVAMRVNSATAGALASSAVYNLILATGVRVGALILPVALARLFWPNARRPWAAYILIQSACVLLISLAAVGDEIFNSVRYREMVESVPTCAFVVGFWKWSLTPDDQFNLLLCPALVSAAALLILFLFRMRAPLREICAMEKVAAEGLEKPLLTAAAA